VFVQATGRPEPRLLWRGMSTEITTGLFALGGVIVGGLLNFVVAHMRDRRVERIERRTAARLLLPELIAARRGLRQMRRSRKIWLPFELERWSQHASSLARLLDDRTWRDLAAIYESLWLFNDEGESFGAGDESEVDDRELLVLPADAAEQEAKAIAEIDRAFHDALTSLNEEALEWVDQTLELLDDAIARLARLAGTSRDPLD
jgi:hypothetical protein